MKIFTLETKKHLAGWSVILGAVLLAYISLSITKTVPCDSGIFGFISGNCKSFGWPFSITLFEPPTKLFLNFVFWVLVSFLMLGVLRRKKYGNKKINIKN